MRKIVLTAALVLGLASSAMAQVFVGINANGGFEVAWAETTGMTIGAGADLGALMTGHNVWGLFAQHSFGLGTASHTGLGLLHLPRYWNERKAFVWGVGVDMRSAIATPYGQMFEESGLRRDNVSFRAERGYGLLLRAGVSFKWHLYVMGSVGIGGYTLLRDVYSMHSTATGWHYDGYHSSAEKRAYLSLGVNIGYAF